MKEPMFKIRLRLRKMTLADQCSYLIACRNCEADDSQRKRDLDRDLMRTRTRQIRHENKLAAIQGARS